MGHTIKLAALGAVAFMVLDGVWLGLLMKNFYRDQLAPIVRLACGGLRIPVRSRGVRRLRLHELLHTSTVAVCADAGRRGVGSGGVSRRSSGRPECGSVRKQRSSPAPYPIRAVSKLTGIAIDTLRAWERRHRAVTPVRDDRGRMYTDADI